MCFNVTHIALHHPHSKEPNDRKDNRTSDKWPSMASCLDHTIFTTIWPDYLSCCDLWDQPAVVIYCVTDQWVQCLLVSEGLLPWCRAQMLSVLIAPCLAAGSQTDVRPHQAPGPWERGARDLFMFVVFATELSCDIISCLGWLVWQTDDIYSAEPYQIFVGNKQILMKYKQ